MSNENKFRPEDHLTPIKTSQGMKPYLPVQWRVAWFRSQYPHGKIYTEELAHDPEKAFVKKTFDQQARSWKETTVYGWAKFRAVVEDGEGGYATGSKCEDAAGFPDYYEKAETSAIGRALSNLGFGTAYAADEYEEGERLADSPVNGATRTNVRQIANGR